MELGVHTILFWFGVYLVPGYAPHEHYFCVDTCRPYAEVCVLDDPRGVICSHTFEAPRIGTEKFCTTTVRYVAVNERDWWAYEVSPGLTMCVDVEQTVGEF